MAINFEAANMAGYNNPKIEVFKAHSGDASTLDEAPSKTDLLNCIHRGSVPFIMLNVLEAFYILLPCSAIFDNTETGGTAISFTFTGVVLEGAAPAEARIIYPYDNNPPIFTLILNT